MASDRGMDDETESVVLADRYEISVLLGSGGMADVYQGRDLELDRPVAVKLLPHRAEQDQEQSEGLRREARTAAALNHPCVVAVHDIGSSGDHVYVVMEYLAGNTPRRDARP